MQAATLGGQPPNPRDIFGQKMEKAKCFGHGFLTLSLPINRAVQGGIPMTATGNGVLSGFRGGQGVFRFLSLNILGGFGGRKTPRRVTGINHACGAGPTTKAAQGREAAVLQEPGRLLPRKGFQAGAVLIQKGAGARGVVF